MLDGFIKNNNEDKARHDQLMLQKQQYDNIIYNTNVGTWRWNIQTGETTFNERWAQILGYTLAELEPTNIETWTRLTHPIDLKKSEKLLKDHIEGLSEFYENEIRMRHKDGHWVWILDTGMVINKSKEGEPMLLSGIHQDISSRKQLEVNLRQKLHFEKALATISKEFIASPDIDDAINMALKQLGSVTSASRIYVFLLKNNNSVMDNTHEWCANGVSPQMDNLKDLDVNIFPWWMDKLNKGEIIQIADVGQLPPEASAEKEILESQEIKSLIVIGLRVNGKLAGFVGFDNVSAEMTGWSLEELNLLLWLVQIFSNALESRAAKEKLRKSELKFRNIFELNPSPQILIDPTNGDILELNQAALVFYGYRHNDLLKMNFIKLSGVNEEKTHKKFKTKLKELVNNSYYQIRQKTHSGIFRELELFSGIITIDDVEILHVIMHDISEKIRMADRNQLLRTAVDRSPFGIVITDINGVIEEVNPTILKSTGYEMEELIGKNARIFNSGKQEYSFFSHLWNTILSGKTWSGEIQNKKKNGELFWESMSIVPIFNEFGDLIKFVSIKENITDKIRMMQDLIEAKNEAEESNRLKSAFLSTINHELRTPLNHVIGISNIINEMATDETIKEFSYIVHRSGIHLLEIIEDILNLALADQMTIKSKEEKILILDIYMFLKDSLFEIHNKSGVQDQINIRLAPETRILNFEFRSDRSKINMIMLNLFKNAIKFTSRGFVEFGFNSTDTHLNFFVRDSGIGIPTDKQDIIFDFFRQVNDTDTRQHDGLGVGLAIAKKSADSIGAELVVHSELGKGSEFILKIPQIPQPIYRNQSYQDDEAVIGINLSDKVILLVDDDVDSLLVSHMLLKQTNAKILEARNGIEAIEVFQNNKIDLILMDLKMPLMDGYKATTLIKSERKDIPIIGLTSYSFLDDQLKAKAAGCDDIITKPLDKRILFSQLKQYLYTNELPILH